MNKPEYEFSIFEPAESGGKYSLYVEEATYEPSMVADYEFDSLEEAKAFAEKWVSSEEEGEE
jgi:hypothetical protein